MTILTVVQDSVVFRDTFWEKDVAICWTLVITVLLDSLE